MAISNFTEDEKYKSFQELACSTKLTEGIHNKLICLSVLNIFLSVTAFLGNTLILVALHKESSLHPLTKLLFRSLATTDLCVGIIVQPLVVTYFMSAMNERWNICRYAYVAALIAGYILTSVSLFTLTAISVDRLLALLLGLRYRQVVTLKRIYPAVAAFWGVSIIGSTMYLWDYLITLWYGYIGISVCLVTSIFSYVKISVNLRRHQIQVQVSVDQGLQNRTTLQNKARFRRTVSSALWVQIALVVCYLPYGILEILVIQRGISSSLSLLKAFAVTLIYLNSSLDPILYCWKIREGRQAVKDTIRELFSPSP